jgi:hypothetical protein
MEIIPMIKTMVIESVSAFNGMDVLVARDAGLFTAEGLEQINTSLQQAAHARR